MHTHMDVSRFTTGKTSVLCENSMHIETQYLGLTPLVFNAHEVNDTFNANTYIIRSVCCIPIGATCYAVAAVCGACGCVVTIITGLINPCCVASEHLSYNTTQWGKQSCLYETFCSENAAKPVVSE